MMKVLQSSSLSDCTTLLTSAVPSRFEQHLSTTVDQSDACSRQSLEYLLFAPKSEMESDLMHIIEEGFNSGRESGNGESDSSVCVTNSLGLIQHEAEVSQGSVRIQEAGCRGRVRVILVLITRGLQSIQPQIKLLIYPKLFSVSRGCCCNFQ